MTTRNPPPPDTPSLVTADDLAAARTLLAAERNLMAWIRTSLSLLTFSFTIFKVLQGLEAGTEVFASGVNPRNVGLFLAGMGTLAMLMGTLDHWHSLKVLRQGHEFRLARPPMIMAVLMSVVGLVLFFGILARVL